MVGRIMITVFNILFLTYMILFVTFFYLHKTMQANVEEVTYQVAEIISTRGEFTKNLYDYLRFELNKYGKFDIRVGHHEKRMDGRYDVFFDDSREVFDAFENTNDATRLSKRDSIDIINGKDIDGNIVSNKKFEMEDQISIQVESQDPTIFGKILNAMTLGYTRDKYIDTKLFALKTAVIVNSPQNVTNGYDVIMEINNLTTNTDNIIIEVVTKPNANDVDKRHYYRTAGITLNLTYESNDPFKNIPDTYVFNSYNLNTVLNAASEKYYILPTAKFVKEITENVRRDGGAANHTYISYRYIG